MRRDRRLELRRLLGDSRPDADRWELLGRLLKGWPRSGRDDAMQAAIAGLAAWPDTLRVPGSRGRPLWPLIRTVTLRPGDALGAALDNPDLSPTRLTMEGALTARSAAAIARRWPQLTAISAWWDAAGARAVADGRFAHLTTLGGLIRSPAAGRILAEARLPGVSAWALQGTDGLVTGALQHWMRGPGLTGLRSLLIPGNYLLSDTLLAALSASGRAGQITGIEVIFGAGLTPAGLAAFLHTDGVALTRLHLRLGSLGEVGGLFEAPGLIGLTDLGLDIGAASGLWGALMASPLRSLRSLSLRLNHPGEIGSHPPGAASAVLDSIEALSVTADRGLFAGDWLASAHLARVHHLSLSAGFLHTPRVQALLDGPALSGIETLGLRGNLDSAAIAMLAADARLATLHTLDIPGAWVNAPALEAVLCAPQATRLAYVRTPRVRGAWEPEEAAAMARIAQSPTLSRLLDLRIEGRWIRSEDARLLAGAATLHPDLRARFRRMG